MGEEPVEGFCISGAACRLECGFPIAPGASRDFQRECQQLRAASPILLLQPPISLQTQGLSTLQVGFPRASEVKNPPAIQETQHELQV